MHLKGGAIMAEHLRKGLPREEEVLAYAAIAVLVAAIVFVVAAILA
jgi:hypothetical protein